MGWAILVIGILIILVLASCVKVVPQAHAYVVERLGAYQGTWSVGLHIKMPLLDKVAKKVNLKEQVVDFAPQPVITKDNVTRSCSHTGWKIRLWRLKTLRRRP